VFGGFSGSPVREETTQKSINTGICIVIPAETILEVIQSAFQVEEEEEIIRVRS
jgi:hypothetical protein